MEIGQTGPNGQPAACLVEEEIKHRQEAVVTQHHLTVEKIAVQLTWKLHHGLVTHNCVQ
jgi:hypothetical protein